MLPIADLDIEETEGLENAFMTKNDTEAILALLHQVKPRTMVEFGVNYGFTARELLKRVPSIESYIGIDVDSPDYVPPFLPSQRVEIPEEPGREAKSDPRFRLIVRPRGAYDLHCRDIGPVDAALIDGDHSRQGVENDTGLALSCVRPGGVIMWHDYSQYSTVDVPQVLHELWEKGHPLFWARGASLAFQRT